MPSNEWPDEKATEAAAIRSVGGPANWSQLYEHQRAASRSSSYVCLAAAAKASPVIPAPKDAEPGRYNEGPIDTRTVDRILYFLRYIDWQEDTAADAVEAEFGGKAGPVAEVIPVAVLRDLRTWIDKSQASMAFRSQDFEAGKRLAFEAVIGWLDEHTRKEPTQA